MTPNPKIQALIKSLGIIPESEHYEIAELIVRECANMAQTFHNHQYDFTGDLELHEFMLKHFGVEE
jgi:hypothetical protein